MELEFYCPRWGSEHIDWSGFMLLAVNEGYQGVEWAIPAETTDRELDQVWNLAAGYQLKVIPQHFDTTDADYNRHYDLYASWLERITSYPAPKINSQTGRDIFSFGQNLSLLHLAEDMANSKETRICHETHRGKFSFAAHITGAFLKQLPDLELTLDLSHWVCVAESYLEDQAEALELAIGKTAHIHARVGHSQGPQVSDPRISEWQAALEQHLYYWQQACDAAKERGEQTLTISPEFGPYPYMGRNPQNGREIACQWEINAWMMETLKNRLKI